jgi:hypothetical protein
MSAETNIYAFARADNTVFLLCLKKKRNKTVSFTDKILCVLNVTKSWSLLLKLYVGKYFKPALCKRNKNACHAGTQCNSHGIHGILTFHLVTCIFRCWLIIVMSQDSAANTSPHPLCLAAPATSVYQSNQATSWLFHSLHVWSMWLWVNSFVSSPPPTHPALH